MIQEMEDLLAYEPHPELDRAGNKKTKISIVGRFLENTGYISPTQVASTGPTVEDVTFDNGGTGVALSTSLIGIAVGDAASTATPTETSGVTVSTTTTTTSGGGTSSSSSSSSSSSGSSSSSSSGSSGSSSGSSGGSYGGGY